METKQTEQIKQALALSNADKIASVEDIQFRMIRDLGGSGFTRIYRVDTNVGEYVAKFATDENPAADREMLVSEAEGLQALSKQNHIRIPRVISSPANNTNLLLTDFIAQAQGTSPQAKSDFQRTFGQSLAQMHLSLKGDRFGWHRDNFIGATTQSNSWSDNWPEFWLQQRMLPQIRLAEHAKVCSTEDIVTLKKLADKVSKFMQGRTYDCHLIHGDLWSGNFWSDRLQQPVIIDPACYFADPIAELGMLSLFGGVGESFHAAYFDFIPQPADLEITIAIYRFYHLLNHLNLFGEPYRTQVQLTANELLKRL